MFQTQEYNSRLVSSKCLNRTVMNRDTEQVDLTGWHRLISKTSFFFSSDGRINNISSYKSRNTLVMHNVRLNGSYLFHFFFFFRERWTESTESFTFIFKKANVNKKRKKQKETCVECFVNRVPPLVEKGLN